MNTNPEDPAEPATPRSLDDFLGDFANWDRPGYDLLQDPRLHSDFTQ
ncbi:MAG: hypothetical protein KF760_08955 [Candidatus Eremiobacteraeota bacterium]|nr:hypothetical protein [Candidatus Eremiobacteraeota bacterium]